MAVTPVFFSFRFWLFCHVTQKSMLRNLSKIFSLHLHKTSQSPAGNTLSSAGNDLDNKQLETKMLYRGRKRETD